VQRLPTSETRRQRELTVQWSLRAELELFSYEETCDYFEVLQSNKTCIIYSSRYLTWNSPWQPRALIFQLHLRLC